MNPNKDKRDNYSSFDNLYNIIDKLRGPDGCPWDKKQTAADMKSFLVEEAFESIDAIDSGNPVHICEELGDLMMIVAMTIKIHEEKNHFSKEDVFREICNKMIRRHPHVFSDEKADTAEDVKVKWDKIKIEIEGKHDKEEYLSTVPRNIPPLERAYNLQKKASKVGFDWTSIEDVFGKLREEIDELEETFSREESPERKQEELGDTIFSLINISRYLKIDPCLALHGTNRKFYNRFKYMEERILSEGLSLSKEKFSRMDSLWNEAKEKGIK